MAWYTDERWKDFQRAFPNQTRSIVLGAVVAMKVDLSALNGELYRMVRVALVFLVAGAAFWVENFLYNIIREIFR